MTIDEIVMLIQAIQPSLSPIQEWILRCSWEGRTYTWMAEERHYRVEYLRRVGAELWDVLSQEFGEQITKLNMRKVLESQPLREGQQALIARSHPAAILAEFPASPLPLGSPFYIFRPPIEDVACRKVLQPGSLIRIKAPMKMGKTSLILRMLDTVQSHQGKTVSIDFHQADIQVFESLDRFLRWIFANINKQLNLESRIEHYWDEELGSKVSCTYYLEECILESLDGLLVIAFDELNRVFEYPKIAAEFLPMLRFWHSQSIQSSLWKRLTLVLAYSTEVYVPLSLNQSPFNVGIPLELPPFAEEQVRSLLLEYGLDWRNQPQIEKFIQLVGGFPYLVHLGLYHLHRGDVTLDTLLNDAPTEAGIYRHHLRQQLSYLKNHLDMLQAYHSVICADVPVKLDAITAYRLNSLGLVHLQGNRAYPSCGLYRLYFSEQLIL